jgi:hypothetical protein
MLGTGTRAMVGLLVVALVVVPVSFGVAARADVKARRLSGSRGVRCERGSIGRGRGRSVRSVAAARNAGVADLRRRLADRGGGRGCTDLCRVRTAWTGTARVLRAQLMVRDGGELPTSSPSLKYQRNQKDRAAPVTYALDGARDAVQCR